MSLSGSSHHPAYSRASMAPLLHVQWEELSRLLDRNKLGIVELIAGQTGQILGDLLLTCV